MQLDSARCYKAVVEKDGRFDGLFFSGIVTTGVYCRAVCPVPRQANLENIRFFPSAAGAEAAGFRPCRRCHPERAATIGIWSGVPSVVSHALNLIAEGALDGGTVELLAQRVGIGSRQLRRLFEEHLGASPLAIAKAGRVSFARRLLDETDLPLARLALAAGFRSVRQFNHDLRRTFGRTPSELRRSSPRERSSGHQLAVRLPYRPPLDWTRMIAFLQPRATRGVEVVEHDRYRRTVRVDGTPATIELRLVPDKPWLVFVLRSTADARLIDLVDRAQRIFDLGADTMMVDAHLSGSLVLGDLVRRRAGIRVPGAWDRFELAVRAILGQQITVRGASTLAARLVAAFGEPYDGGDGLTHLFPTASTLAEADLTRIGSTRAQARTVRALAAAVAAGELAIEAPKGLDEFVGRICCLPGVGPWTAHYIAMRACGEPDAFPASDLGLRRMAGDGTPLTVAAMSRRAEEWRPWRAYAAMYLWTSESVGSRGGGERRRADTSGRR